MSYDKGARRERELIDKLRDYGYVGLRAPSSGSTTQRELPDVLMGNDGHVMAFEVKASSGDPIYIGGSEVEDLEFFANAFGAEAYFAARFDRTEWFFVTREEMHRTNGGNFRIKKVLGEDVERGLEVICQ